jgi:hypothetical protein
MFLLSEIWLLISFEKGSAPASQLFPIHCLATAHPRTMPRSGVARGVPLQIRWPPPQPGPPSWFRAVEATKSGVHPSRRGFAVGAFLLSIQRVQLVNMTVSQSPQCLRRVRQKNPQTFFRRRGGGFDPYLGWRSIRLRQNAAERQDAEMLLISQREEPRRYARAGARTPSRAALLRHIVRRSRVQQANRTERGSVRNGCHPSASAVYEGLLGCGCVRFLIFVSRFDEGPGAAYE